MPVLHPGISETQLDHHHHHHCHDSKAQLDMMPVKSRKIMGSLSQALRGIKLQSSLNDPVSTTTDLTNYNNQHSDQQHQHNQLHHNQHQQHQFQHHLHQHSDKHHHHIHEHGGKVAEQAMIMAYDSSGSVHEPGTVCLAAMVNEFIEDVGSCGRARCNCGDDQNCAHDKVVCGDSNGNCSTSDLDEYDDLCQILEEAVNGYDKHEGRVLKDVMHAVQLIKNSMDPHKNKEQEQEQGSGDHLLFWVMKHLRSVGYNAAVCKSRWENAGALPAGNYEYIDVTYGNDEDRIIIDTDFRAQFEIARASERYNGLLEMVPCIFVGKPKRLSIVLKTMSKGAKLSLKHMGMHLPPWRKHCYLQAKWFSSYKRTVRTQPSAMPNESSIDPNCLGGIAFKAPFFSSKFKDEIEDFYGMKDILLEDRGLHQHHQPKPINNIKKHSMMPLPHEITIITTDWQLPALDPSHLDRRRPHRPTSGIADALRQQERQHQINANARTNTLKKPSQVFHFRTIAC